MLCASVCYSILAMSYIDRRSSFERVAGFIKTGISLLKGIIETVGESDPCRVNLHNKQIFGEGEVMTWSG